MDESKTTVLVCTCRRDGLTELPRECDHRDPACHHPGGTVNRHYAIFASQTTDRTVDDVLHDLFVIHSGRTRYSGQKPRDDELLVAEIERLRHENEELRAKLIQERGYV